MSTSPVAVSRSRRGMRSKIGAPSSFSRARICRLIAEEATLSRAAALRIDPSRATSSRYFSSRECSMAATSRDRALGRSRDAACPRIHRPAQSLGNDALKASLRAKIDAFYKHSNVRHRAVKRTQRGSPAGGDCPARCSQPHPREPTMSRFRIASLAAAAAFSLIAAQPCAADKVTFLTSWYAQAEHGGFYQAKADRPLREGRARRHHQDGRPAGERHAAPARRRGRHDDGLRLPGAQVAREGLPVDHRRAPRSRTTCRA